MRVKARGQRDLITVVGHAAPIGAGEFMRASTHGVQFRADFCAWHQPFCGTAQAAPASISTALAFYGDCRSVYAGGPFLISESVSQDRTA